MFKQKTSVILGLVLLFSACKMNVDESHLLNYQQPLNELVNIEEELLVLIDKSDYKLSILQDDIVLKEYPVVFGGNSVDDKLKEGDKCTPEGTFKIQDKYPHQKWSKFIWINYPTEESWKKHNKAKEDGVIENDATIGGEIGIHGVPEGKDFLITQQINWTLGCIALKNKDVNEIYNFINENSTIIIQQ